MSIKERFITQVLEKEGQRMLRNQGFAIRTAYKSRSGRLLNERKVVVTGGEVPRLHFDHPMYERFLDLKSKKNTDRRIHNRFVYGTYYGILHELMTGFTEEVATEIAKSVYPDGYKE